MNFFIRMALITMAFGLWGCQKFGEDSGTSQFGGSGTGSFFCVAPIAKCEYGAGKVYQVGGSVEGHANSDICPRQPNDPRPVWTVFTSEPLLDRKVCRFQGMTRMEMACKCEPVNGQNSQAGQQVGQSGSPQPGEPGYRNPNVAPQEAGNFGGQGSPTGARNSWGNNQTTRLEYQNTNLVECYQDGIGFVSGPMMVKLNGRLPYGYCKKVDDFDGAISCHEFRDGRANYNIFVNCRAFYKGDFTQAKSFRKLYPGTSKEPVLQR